MWVVILELFSMTFDTRWRLVELIFLEKQGTIIWIIYRRTHFRGSSIKDVGNWKGVGVINWLKGDTDKQALKLICQRFFNFQPIILKFSANASFLRPFEWRNQIWPNPTAQCTFCTVQHTFCTVFPTFSIFKNKKLEKQCKICTVQ